MSFLSALQESKKRAQAAKDPWLLRLEGLRGKKWDDGIERISTQTMFDVLEVPHSSRTAGACRRLVEADAGARMEPNQGARTYSGRISRPSARLRE